MQEPAEPVNADGNGELSDSWSALSFFDCRYCQEKLYDFLNGAPFWSHSEPAGWDDFGCYFDSHFKFFVCIECM